MRILLFVVALLAALWSGYWYVGSSAKEAVISSWLDGRRADGWTADYASFDVVGFPNRFDSRFTDITLADTRAGWSWQAPFFNILALSYQPNHIIAVWPHTQVFGFPLEEITVTSTEMIASVVFEPDTKLALERTALRMSDLALSGSSGWKASADKFDFSSRQTKGKQLTHTIVFETLNLTPTQIFKNNVDPANNLPGAIDRVFVSADITFNAPWDRISAERGLPVTTAIDLNDVSAHWGALDLRAKGQLDVNPSGDLRGNITLTIRDWRGVLSLLVSSGAIPEGLAKQLNTGLSLLTALSDDPDTLTAPLRFGGGKMFLGPVSLGAAPRLRRY